jgi:hypothetical protein
MLVLLQLDLVQIRWKAYILAGGVSGTYFAVILQTGAVSVLD